MIDLANRTYILVELEDGNLHQSELMIPLASDEQIEAVLAKTYAGQPVAPVGWRRINPLTDIPADRTYRGAWRNKGDEIDHDMPVAREIHRDLLRFERGPMLERLDREYLRADERGDGQEKKRIAQEKQRLRDAPADPRIEAAQTTEELKAISL